ncbi:MAG: hypothetical protein QNJ30_23735 [Kiloniellales bacterium]|nr:hypothetical protein [Kiloniellales bacterium]
MNEIFADGISGIVIANNVVRVELARLRPTGQGDQQKLVAQTTATLILPTSALREFTTQLANSVKQIAERAAQEGGEAAAATPEGGKGKKKGG